MNILCLDTIAQKLSILLKTSQSSWTLSADTNGRHSESLMDMLRLLFRAAEITPAELNLLACLRGPGSFTGVRLGFAAVKGVAAATGARAVSVPSLDCIASPFLELPLTVVPAVDSRRNQFYTAVYRGGKRVTDELDVGPAKIATLLQPGDKVLITGPDADKLYCAMGEYRRTDISYFFDPNYQMGQVNNLIKIIENGSIIQLNWDGELAEPVYIRKSDAEEKCQK